MPRPKQRTPELRRHIIETAVDVLSAQGVSAFTTRSVAEAAATSVPALYELFGDKAGLIRELFFEGFRRLRTAYDDLAPSPDPVADLRAAAATFRRFALANPELFAIMFSQPFDLFQPDRDARETGTATRTFLVDRIQRSIETNQLTGDATDIAHGLLALGIGLATQETSGWLGGNATTRDRRWNSAINGFLGGFSSGSPPAPPPATI